MRVSNLVLKTPPARVFHGLLAIIIDVLNATGLCNTQLIMHGTHLIKKQATRQVNKNFITVFYFEQISEKVFAMLKM